MKPENLRENNLYSELQKLISNARQKVVRAVNQTMVYTYYEIGKIIIEYEQNGRERASYGKNSLKNISQKLSTNFGKGFSVDNLENMRKFYLAYSKSETASRKFQLSYSHYLKLIRIQDIEERKFYEIEAIQNSWSLRELKRQTDTALYQRLVLSRDKEKIKALSIEGQIISQPKDLLKDPYILEFIGLPESTTYSETDLEQKLIDKLEHFLLELGKGFTFVARQKRITFDE